MEKEFKLFSKTHEWVELLDRGRALVGLSSYAVEQLGSIVFVNLPMKGDVVQAEQSFGDVESVKAVSEMISPVTGTVVNVNEAVFDEPGLLNEDPYNTWLLEIDDIKNQEELLTYSQYQSFIGKS